MADVPTIADLHSSVMAFDSETATVAGARGLAVRHERWAEQRRASEMAYRIITELDDIAPAALETTLRGLRRGLDALDEVPIDNALDAKRVLESAEIAHRISRLASGQSTSNVAHRDAMSDEERRERMAYLRSRIGQLDTPTQPGQVSDTTPPTT